MKAFLLILAALCCKTLNAQLYIGNSATFYLSGNAELSLSNADFMNNGNFTAGNSTIHFLGNASSTISGSQPTSFYELLLNKSGGNSVLLQRMIGVNNRITFTAGLLNLNGYDIDLGTTGYLNNEQENSRITGSSGGQVLFSTTLNAPFSANPGNLGAIITSSQNLGAVLIKRGHQSLINSFGNGSSILRYFDINPANNSSLNASLRFHYFDGELNSLDENTLVMWKSADNMNWTNLGFSSRDVSLNYVEKTNIGDFSRWTLSTPDNALPVTFSSFNIFCGAGHVTLSWKTAQEFNSDHFDIESSIDGQRWTVNGSVPAAGYSSSERSYSFTDYRSTADNFYRIIEYDKDGRKIFGRVLRIDCIIKESFTAWPNPVKDLVSITINLQQSADVKMLLFNAKGSLIKVQSNRLSAGSNQLFIDMSNMPGGVYTLQSNWGNNFKAIKLIKL